MNIFVTDNCPVVSAHNLANKHISRMPLETKGILAYVFPDGYTPFDNSHAHSHYMHPACIWARQSRVNMEWTILHGIAQCEEYTRRYKRVHDSEAAIRWVADNYDKVVYPKLELTPFARCFGPFKKQLDLNVPDTIEAYRQFYILDKPFARWPCIDAIPHWWPNKDESWVDKNFKDGIYTKR